MPHNIFIFYDSDIHHKIMVSTEAFSQIRYLSFVDKSKSRIDFAKLYKIEIILRYYDPSEQKIA